MRIYTPLICFLLTVCLAGSVFAANDLEALIRKGNEAFNKAEYKTAIKIYEKGLKAAPKEAILFYNKANALQHLEKYGEALEFYQTAIKSSPKKVLLKNIYFNAGNAHFKMAGKKIGEGADLEALKEALGEYEKAFEKYRKSLELDREISIAQGTDIHKAGIYAKQNWALARDAWTKTWESIREIEKKNLKLEDGIQNLMQAQKDLLPRLESFYLYSFSQDSLKFNLKTLAQYHMDYQEDIRHLQQIAQKDVERVFTELENYKSTKKQDSKQAPIGAQEDPELAKLKKAHEDARSIQKGVDGATGLENWIVDGLNRSEPIKAWQNARSMIRLLEDLGDYLKKSDHIKNLYTAILSDLYDVHRLIPAIKQAEDKENDIKQRMATLGAVKLDASAGDFTRINGALALLKNELEKESETFLSDSPPPQDSIGKKQAQSEIQKIFERVFKKIAVESVKDVIARNETLIKKLTKSSTALKEKKFDAIETNLEAMVEDLMAALVGYENIRVPLIALFTSMVKNSETVLDSLEELAQSDVEAGKEKSTRFTDHFVLMEQLFFKYRVVMEKIRQEDKEELAVLAKNLPQFYSSLESSWNKFETASSAPLKSVDDAANLENKVTVLRQELLKSMVMLAPDAAIALYFERIRSLQDKVVNLLPSIDDNRPDIQKRYGRTGKQVRGLDGLLSQYFEQYEKIIDKIEDHETKDPLQKQLDFRKEAQNILNHGRSEIEAAYGFLEKGKYLKNDLLAKDLLTTIDKSYLAFLEAPKEADKTLEAAINWQKLLKEQSREAREIAILEGEAKTIAKYLTRNQTDITNTAGRANMKIRKMMESAGKGNKQQGAGPAQPGVPGLLPPGAQANQADPKKMEEAIKYIQDAMIEAGKIKTFLEAGEFHNTDEKHGQVIELLEKALEALRSKQEGSCDNKNQDKSKEQDKQSGEDQPKQGGQGEKQQPKPLELTPQQARELLNQLNKQDAKGKKTEGKRVIDTPRPW